MDWVDEKMETFRIWIRNLPIKKALIAYLCIAAVAALLLSFATTQVCERWMDILVERNALDTDSMYASDGGHYFQMVSICVYSDHDAGVCFLFLPEAAKKTVCHPGGGCGPDWQEGSGFYGLLCE